MPASSSARTAPTKTSPACHQGPGRETCPRPVAWSPSLQRANSIGLWGAVRGLLPAQCSHKCCRAAQAMVRGGPRSHPARLRLSQQRCRGCSDSILRPMQDLLKHTPSSHPDHLLLQDALRISQNFLSSINEEITPRRQSMTVKKGEVSMAAEQRWAWGPLYPHSSAQHRNAWTWGPLTLAG